MIREEDVAIEIPIAAFLMILGWFILKIYESRNPLLPTFTLAMYVIAIGIAAKTIVAIVQDILK